MAVTPRARWPRAGARRRRAPATAQEARRVRTEVGARGQYDRYARSKHDAGRIRFGQESEVLGEHVAGFEIGNDQDLGSPGDGRLDTFDLRGLGIDGIVESERPVEDAAGDLAAIGHLAQSRRLDRRGDLGGDRLDGRENGNPRRTKPDLGEQVDRVLDDVALGVEIGSRY